MFRAAILPRRFLALADGEREPLADFDRPSLVLLSVNRERRTRQVGVLRNLRLVVTHHCPDEKIE